MDHVTICDELLEAGSGASPDLWDRFAESVDQLHRQMNEQAEQEVRKFRGELLDSVCMADMISTAVNTAYAAGRSDRRATEAVQ